MNTLKQIVINLAASTRTGPATGITSHGEYWLVAGLPFVTVRSFTDEDTGDSIKHRLELRHYRSGEVRATIRVVGETCDSGRTIFADASPVLAARSCAEVIAILKGLKVNGRHAFGIPCAKWVLQKLTKLGLPAEQPAPGRYDQPLAVTPPVAPTPTPERAPYVAPTRAPAVYKAHPSSERFAKY